MSELNIVTFNDILLKAAKDDESKIKMIEGELGIIANMFMDEVALLLDELEKIGYKSEQFQKLQNIKSNSEILLEMLEKLYNKVKEGD